MKDDEPEEGCVTVVDNKINVALDKTASNINQERLYREMIANKGAK